MSHVYSVFLLRCNIIATIFVDQNFALLSQQHSLWMYSSCTHLIRLRSSHRRQACENRPVNAALVLKFNMSVPVPVHGVCGREGGSGKRSGTEGEWWNKG